MSAAGGGTAPQDQAAGQFTSYPSSLHTRARQALYDNLDKDGLLAVAVDNAVKENMQNGWLDNAIKVKKVRNAIKSTLGDDCLADTIQELVKHQHDYR